MPKYGIHHIVLKEAAAQLAALQDPLARSAGEAVHAELPSAVIGSVGPDLFFWGPDYAIVKKLYRLYRNIEEVVAIYNRVVAPIRQVTDAVGEATEAVVGSLAPNTLELVKLLVAEVKQTAALFKSALGVNLLNGVLDGVNLVTDAAGLGSASQAFFQFFVPDLHHNRKEKDWYWFDMLHYRRTGLFARGLVRPDGLTPRQKAFSYGYLSHVAADVVGHPYVNSIVGAPYRLNVQRHVTAENFQDSWKFARYYGGESINRTLLSRMGLPERLPTDVGDLLDRAFRGAYGDLPVDRRPGRLHGRCFGNLSAADKKRAARNLRTALIKASATARLPVAPLQRQGVQLLRREGRGIEQSGAPALGEHLVEDDRPGHGVRGAGRVRQKRRFRPRCAGCGRPAPRWGRPGTARCPRRGPPGSLQPPHPAGWRWSAPRSGSSRHTFRCPGRPRPWPAGVRRRGTPVGAGPPRGRVLLKNSCRIARDSMRRAGSIAGPRLCGLLGAGNSSRSSGCSAPWG